MVYNDRASDSNLFKLEALVVVTKIKPDYTLNIPDQFRSILPAGQQVAISADAHGRLVITPIEQIEASLMETFGMWANRTDVPADGVEYTHQLRRGRRLEELGLFDETD